METQVNHNLQFTDEGLQSVDCRRIIVTRDNIEYLISDDFLGIPTVRRMVIVPFVRPTVVRDSSECSSHKEGFAFHEIYFFSV